MVKVADPVGHIVLASSVPTVDSLPEVPMGEAEAVAAYGNLAEELSKQGGRFVILVFSHFAGWFTKPGPKRKLSPLSAVPGRHAYYFDCLLVRGPLNGFE